MKETRVGYMSISIIEEMLKDYIKAFTEDKKYIGRLDYLDIYRSYERYLKWI